MSPGVVTVAIRLHPVPVISEYPNGNCSARHSLPRSSRFASAIARSAVVAAVYLSSI